MRYERRSPEQRLAVVADEDVTLVLAGAGSGKTSVIVAKAAYLIPRSIRQPDEILLMAFGNGAAAEMAEMIEERSGATVDALTFHAPGYGIIRDVVGGTPALAAHASDDAEFQVLLCDILFNDLAKLADPGSFNYTDHRAIFHYGNQVSEREQTHALMCRSSM